MEKQNMPKDLVDSEEEYAKARERQLALLEKGYDLGTGGITTWTRDELHERQPEKDAQQEELKDGEASRPALLP